MIYNGSAVYDNEDFFRQYLAKRKRQNSPNETLEQPIIDELLGVVKGKNVLDLGCGSGEYGKALLSHGANHYHGIDGSSRMIGLAEDNLHGLNCRLEQTSLEELKLPSNIYEIVLSRLVLHYMEHLAELLSEVHQSLTDEGEFIFSIEHPIITSHYESYHKIIKRGNWIVDNYFRSGIRINRWIGKDVVKYHRTIEEYWKLLKASGFKIQEIRESKPQSINFRDQSEYERRMRIPLFLIIKAHK